MCEGAAVKERKDLVDSIILILDETYLISLCTHQRISSLTLMIKLKKPKALPFLPVHSSFGKRTVSTLDGALDYRNCHVCTRTQGHFCPKPLSYTLDASFTEYILRRRSCQP